jgi:hypothetical protein
LKPFLLSFEVVLLAVGGDPGVEDGEPVFLLPPETMNFGEGDTTVTSVGAGGPQPTGPIEVTEILGGDPETLGRIGKRKKDLHITPIGYRPLYDSALLLRALWGAR